MLVVNISKNRCPNCGQGNIFQSNNLFSYKSVKMNAECPFCKLDFVKEPGFYWGAMYASYALAILEAFIALIINTLIGISPKDNLTIWIIVSVLLLLSPFNFRMARIIWLYILPDINSHKRLNSAFK